jgi:hypothetical protein
MLITVQNLCRVLNSTRILRRIFVRHTLCNCTGLGTCTVDSSLFVKMNSNGKRSIVSMTAELAAEPAAEPPAKREKKDTNDEEVVSVAPNEVEHDEKDSKPAAAPERKKSAKKPKFDPSPHAGPAFTEASRHIPAASIQALLELIGDKPSGTWKVLSYNANGLRAAIKKPDIIEWLKKEAADVLGKTSVTLIPKILTKSGPSTFSFSPPLCSRARDQDRQGVA